MLGEYRPFSPGDQSARHRLLCEMQPLCLWACSTWICVFACHPVCVFLLSSRKKMGEYKSMVNFICILTLIQMKNIVHNIYVSPLHYHYTISLPLFCWKTKIILSVSQSMCGVLSVTSTKDDLHITIQSKPEQIHLFFPFSLLSALSERLIELLIIE